VVAAVLLFYALFLSCYLFIKKEFYEKLLLLIGTSGSFFRKLFEGVVCFWGKDFLLGI
jgi:hypothetical protein